jgi:conjugative relaxase-like TrwC/TraI family protein
MQTTHKIEGSSAVRFARYLVAEASRGDYYTHDGEGGRSVPTQWHCPERLLRSFGINPGQAVEMKHLGPLLQGFDPVTEKPIRPVGSNGTRVAGIDLSFAPPKEVSALWATTDPYRRAQLEVAHRKAVKSALERTEREVALVRRKANGHVRFETAKGLLATEVVHTTSRLGKDEDEHGIPDPQLHSHIVVIAAERRDGVLAAVESRQLMKAARENGAWYRSELAANLRELGVGIERRQGNGERYFGVRGISKELSERWSTRTEDVHRAANLFRQRYGREPGPGELDSLTLSTRGSKTAASPDEVNRAWRALGEEHNQTARRSEEAFHDWGLHHNPNIDLSKELLAAVTNERSMITEAELHAKAYELSAGVCRPAEADRLIGELVRSGELLELEDGTWTTRQLRELEQATIEIAERRAGEVTAPVSERALKQARREIGKQIKGSLTQEQREALDTVTGPGGIAVLVGPAGTGKGVVISTAARAWQLEGNEVLGISVAGEVAQRLQNEASLDRSYSADELNYGIQQGRIRIGPDTVVIFDEAAMADHERIAPLVKLTAERGAKPLLVGDAAQLSSIGPGGLFTALEGRVPTAELHEVHRANHAWERKAWEQIRAGEPGPALSQYQAHDRLHIHDTRAQAAEAMVKNWDQTRTTLPEGRAVMITDASNMERDQMNAMAQEHRMQAGELGAHEVELPGKPYGLRAGDEIIFTAKYPVPGQERVKNGVTGTVIDTSRREDKITIKTNEHEPREVLLDTSKFNELSLSYAVHINKGQGITAETSGVLIGGWQTDKEHAYVTLSRAREETQIYVSREDLSETGLDVGAVERLAEKMKRSRAQQATITKRLANDPPEPPGRSTEQLTQTEPATQATPDRNPERRLQIEPATEATPDRTLEHPEPERPTYAPPQHEPPARTIESAVQQATETTAPSNTTQGTEREIDEVLKARLARQLDWQRAIDVDRSGNVDEQAKEAEAIENLAEQLRAEGAGEATITKEIAKQTAGREADVERNTQAQREHERHIDRILEQQRQRLLDSEIPREIDRDRDNDRDSDAEHAEQTTHDPTHEHAEQADRESEHAEQPERDPYIEQAIQQARDRQQAWEQGIDQDRENENDRSFGIE